MAHESFEGQGAATVLNRDFLSIKVDREERPDVDAVYMAACQALTGSGGWPLTVLMTPEQRPFFAATYLPEGRLIEMLEQTARLWRDDRAKLFRAADSITEYLKAAAQEPSAAAEPAREQLHRAANYFRKRMDQKWGGFGAPPKFPMGHNLLFLLRYAALERDAFVRVIAELTLEQMARGGLFDHIGGGFSRYSTDAMWLVPHFEKMLYDNALLVPAYLEAYRQTGQQSFARTVCRTLDYVLRELTHPQGGFYSAQDADSGGEEGLFYTFTPDEVIAVLGEAQGRGFCAYYDITPRGNFEGKSIPNRIGGDKDGQEQGYDDARERLYAYRAARAQLHTDDKVLTAWNGLMIAAMAEAGQTLQQPRYLAAAEAAVQFVETRLADKNGALAIRWRDGEAAGEGQLDDYACFAWGLLELHRVMGDMRHVHRAIACMQVMYKRFHDDAGGGFFRTAHDAEQLITRGKETYDGALPSGNSVAAVALCRIAAVTGRAEWRNRANKQLRFVAGAAESAPAAATFGLLAVLELLGGH